MSAAAGQLISRLTSDCYSITRCIATNVNVAMRNLLQVIGEVQTHCSSSSTYAARLLSCLRAQHVGHSAVHPAALPSAQLPPAVTGTRQQIVAVPTGCGQSGHNMQGCVSSCGCRWWCHLGDAVSWAVWALPGYLHNPVGLHHHVRQLQQAQPESGAGARRTGAGTAPLFPIALPRPAV